MESRNSAGLNDVCHPVAQAWLAAKGPIHTNQLIGTIADYVCKLADYTQ
jgi:hypothetical protein